MGEYTKCKKLYWLVKFFCLKNRYIFYFRLEKQLGIQTLDDWYNISSKDISLYYQGGRLLNKYGGLKSFLLYYYPSIFHIYIKNNGNLDHNWDMKLLDCSLQKKPSKAQIRLSQIIQKIFPDYLIEIG